MCGIFFVPGFSNLSPQEQAWCRRASSRMSHRGMRTSVAVYDGDLYVHRRLPIGDVNESGDHLKDQPAMFVGEIFNFKSINPEATHDVDVLMNVFRSQGVEGFHQFDGFWAGVIDGTVFSDYLNQKPIYFRLVPFPVFASEPRMLSMEGFGFDERFFSTVVQHGLDWSGRTAFNGVFMMPPGVMWSQGAFEQYWHWEDVPTPLALDAALRQAFDLRCSHGDVAPVLLASGGLDSTILACMGEPLDLVHADNIGDEDFFPMVPAKSRKMVHVKPTMNEDALHASQTPVDLGSVIPQFALSCALEGHHVVLTGDGADELFGGYRRAAQFDSQPYDVFIELPYYHHPRLDVLMMANTIELRTPFLAPDVVKLALMLPRDQRIGKRILKEMFGSIVPPEILNRGKVPLRAPGFANDLPQRAQRVADFRLLCHD